MSWSGWRATIVAPDVLPSAKVSLIAVDLSTTWRAVRMSPARSTTTPVPRPCCDLPAASGLSASMRTSDGWTAA